VVRVLLGLFLVCLALWIGLRGPDLIYSKKSPNRGSIQKREDDVTSPDIEKIVNKHLKNTSMAIQMQQEMLAVQLKSQAIKPGQNIFASVPQKENDHNPPPIDAKDKSQIRAEEVFKKNRSPYPNSPGNAVLNELGEQQLSAYDEEMAKKEYILEFRRNAWRGGYDVRVDDSGQVTLVRPLPESKKGTPFPEDN
jgi:hypothetical protein